MAKFLAYKRDDKQVVTVDTVAILMETLGNTISAADTGADFAGRSKNVVAQYRGDYYMLYRTSTNQIRLSILNLGAGTWSDVAGFTSITTGSGTLVPLCLHVVRDRLVAICTKTGSAGIDAVIARRSASDDGATWSAATTQVFATQPTVSRAGPSIVWHNAVFFATSEGIGYYIPSSDTLSAVFDDGSDSAIVDEKTTFGSFTFLGGDLYYVLATDNPAGAPTLYKLSKAWSTTTPLSLPAWTKLNVIIPATGDVVINEDTGTYSLFVNKAGVMSLLYSGSLGSKLVTILETGSTFAVTDLSTTLLPASIRSEPNLGFSYFVDDRHAANEQHTVVIRFKPTTPESVNLLSWDGTTALVETGFLDNNGAGLDLMVPEAERGEFRTFTDNEPSCHVDDVSQPFPGRVRIDYTVHDASSRPLDIIAEYSLDGQTWLEMSQGDGDSGVVDLVSSPAGTAYFFHWDVFSDLSGTYDNVDIRVIARISGV